MAERSNAAVLKTVDGQLSGGSNPSLSAKFAGKYCKYAPAFDRGNEETQRFARGRSPTLCRSSRRETAESLSRWKSSYDNALACSTFNTCAPPKRIVRAHVKAGSCFFLTLWVDKYSLKNIA